MRDEPQKALKESQDGLDARFCEVMDAAPVMMWVSGRDKLCTWFNKPWLSFTGRTLAQELGNGWAEGVHTDDFDRCLETYVSHFDGRKQFRMQYRLRHRDGEYRWIEDIGIPRHAHDGSFLGYIGSAIDIHDQKTVEEELRRLKTALELREQRIAADLLDMTRLNRLSNQLVRGGADLNGCLNEVLETAIAISGADKGTVQLFDTITGALTIAAQRGFEDPS
jgi:PAS domain S-box-containing protein